MFKHDCFLNLLTFLLTHDALQYLRVAKKLLGKILH